MSRAQCCLLIFLLADCPTGQYPDPSDTSTCIDCSIGTYKDTSGAHKNELGPMYTTEEIMGFAGKLPKNVIFDFGFRIYTEKDYNSTTSICYCPLSTAHGVEEQKNYLTSTAMHLSN